MADSLPTKDEAIARLDDYQTRLDAARELGPAAYDHLFDGAPPGVALHEIDARGTVTRVNASELAMVGRRSEEILGQPVWRFAVMQDASQRAVEKKLSGAGLRPFVRTLTRADQSGVTVALVERYLKDASGRIVGIRTALTPIVGA
ncbi:MAG TPA: PAS domain-containing protein [Vicinamibacteria bacterium]|nr:PAS domain-containing protein [Vicinamibacteria bacterium]